MRQRELLEDDAHQDVGGIDIVPGNPRWCWEHPGRTTGATKAFPRRLATRSDISRP